MPDQPGLLPLCCCVLLDGLGKGQIGRWRVFKMT